MYSKHVTKLASHMHGLGCTSVLRLMGHSVPEGFPSTRGKSDKNRT